MDGAHNPNGIEALKNAITDFLPDKKIIGIMGMLADKDIDTSIKLLENTFFKIYTVPVDNPRALDSKTLAEKFSNLGFDATSFESAETAFDTAFDEAKENDLAIIICGSLYLAGQIRPYILNK